MPTSVASDLGIEYGRPSQSALAAPQPAHPPPIITYFFGGGGVDDNDCALLLLLLVSAVFSAAVCNRVVVVLKEGWNAEVRDGGAVNASQLIAGSMTAAAAVVGR